MLPRLIAFMEPNGVPPVSLPDTPVEGKQIMGLIILIVVGGILGWLASIVMRTDGQQGIFLNVIVGIVGAFLGGFVARLLNFGGSITDGISIPSLLVSFLAP